MSEHPLILLHWEERRVSPSWRDEVVDRISEGCQSWSPFSSLPAPSPSVLSADSQEYRLFYLLILPTVLVLLGLRFGLMR